MRMTNEWMTKFDTFEDSHALFVCVGGGGAA